MSLKLTFRARIVLAARCVGVRYRSGVLSWLCRQWTMPVTCRLLLLQLVTPSHPDALILSPPATLVVTPLPQCDVEPSQELMQEPREQESRLLTDSLSSKSWLESWWRWRFSASCRERNNSCLFTQKMKASHRSCGSVGYLVKNFAIVAGTILQPFNSLVVR